MVWKLRHTQSDVQERFYFGDTVLPLFESGIPLMRQRMQSLPDADNITIAYPDEGAWKRFHYQFGDYPEASLGFASFSHPTDADSLKWCMLFRLSDTLILVPCAVC